MKKPIFKITLIAIPLLSIISFSAFAETVLFDTLPYGTKKEITEKTKGGAIQSINRTVEGNRAVYEIKSLNVGVLSTIKIEDANWVNNVAVSAPVFQPQPEVKKEEPKPTIVEEAIEKPVLTEVKQEEKTSTESEPLKNIVDEEDQKLEDDVAEDEVFKIEAPTSSDLNN